MDRDPPAATADARHPRPPVRRGPLRGRHRRRADCSVGSVKSQTHHALKRAQRAARDLPDHQEMSDHHRDPRGTPRRRAGRRRAACRPGRLPGARPAQRRRRTAGRRSCGSRRGRRRHRRDRATPSSRPESTPIANTPARQRPQCPDRLLHPRQPLRPRPSGVCTPRQYSESSLTETGSMPSTRQPHHVRRRAPVRRSARAPTPDPCRACALGDVASWPAGPRRHVHRYDIVRINDLSFRQRRTASSPVSADGVLVQPQRDHLRDAAASGDPQS